MPSIQFLLVSITDVPVMTIMIQCHCLFDAKPLTKPMLIKLSSQVPICLIRPQWREVNHRLGNKVVEYISYIPAIVLCSTLPWWYHQLISIHMIYLPTFFKITSLPLGQSYDCPSTSEVILKNMGKITQYLTTTKHNKARTVWIIHGMYCACHMVRSILFSYSDFAIVSTVKSLI